jgi:hypothetical protein
VCARFSPAARLNVTQQKNIFFPDAASFGLEEEADAVAPFR